MVQTRASNLSNIFEEGMANGRKRKRGVRGKSKKG